MTPHVFLIDNGSLKAEATFRLRELAESLARRIGHRVEAVSLLHSHKIDPGLLKGHPASIVKRRLRQLAQAGVVHFVCLPLFLGPSLAVKDYLPKVIEQVRKQYPDIQVRIAEVLSGSDPALPDIRLARILAGEVEALAPSEETKVALVDHGTPVKSVNCVRNEVARQLNAELKGIVAKVQPCSMERRQGKAYAFNEPLLENLSEVPNFSGGHLIVSMFFLLPGRHAGQMGDVTQICSGLMEKGNFASIRFTRLIGESPKLTDILEDRFYEVFSTGERVRFFRHKPIKPAVS